MANLIAIGDIHGRDVWKQICATEQVDQVVFVGDYFDTHESISPRKQKKNFKELVEFKKRHLHKVILLVGNHDFHYLGYTGQQYSGYQPACANEFSGILKTAIDEGLMQMCYTQSNVAFTHAGITNTWAEASQIDLENLETSVNELFNTKPSAFEFTAGNRKDATGDDISQTPIWVRPNSLQKDAIEGYVQVVGHTMQYHLKKLGDIYLIDTLGTSGEYLYWDEDEGFSVRSSL